ncbi:MAG: hypothetical protein GY810_07660 [Aureispira sp.]|nr:hypothetical protein [Aureispira sp.]
MNYLKFAQAFGKHLSEDDFHGLEQLLSENCIYIRGLKRIYGPANIAKRYETNAALAAQKLDWGEGGESKSKMLNKETAEVVLTEYIKHNGLRYTYKFKVILGFDTHGKIKRIEHEDLPGEDAALKDYYRRIGLI